MNSLTRVQRAALVVATSVIAMAGGAAVSGASPRLAAHLPAGAKAAAALRYDYSFAGTKGVVPNSAPGGPQASLTLSGDWTPASKGVHFRGGTHGVYSVAAGRPATGDSWSVPASAATGVRARVRYDAPTTGGCFDDTPNVTQIGRFAADAAQIKLQLSKCADSKTHVVFQCRFAGRLTPLSVDPVASTMHLVGGDNYLVTCIKSRDHANGTATVTLTVTKLLVGADHTVTSTFTVAATGAMVTKQSISVGNKFPVPVSADNTDQFNGDVDSVVYCTGSMAAVQGCVTS